MTLIDLILGFDISADLQAVNGLVQLGAYLQTLSLDGKNPFFVKQLIKEFERVGIACRLTGEERYQMPDYLVP